MSDLKLQGFIVAIFEEIQITDTFVKREFVIETDEDYPQVVKFELTQDKCKLIAGYKVGEQVIVNFNVRGRKWTNKEGQDKYFVSLHAWRLEKIGAAPATTAPKPAPTPPSGDNLFSDDLPF